MERAETIIAACRDTMLTTLEKIGGQSRICSWTRQDGSVVLQCIFWHFFQ